MLSRQLVAKECLITHYDDDGGGGDFTKKERDRNFQEATFKTRPGLVREYH